MHTAQLFFTAGTNSMQTIQHHTTQELELRHCTSTTLTQASTDSSRSEGHPTHTVEDHFLQFVMMILVYVVIFVYYLDETYNTTHQRKRGSRYKHKQRRRRHKQTTQKPHTNTKSASYQLMPARLCKHIAAAKQARLRIYRCKQYFWTRRLLPKYQPYKKNKQSRVHSVTTHTSSSTFTMLALTQHGSTQPDRQETHHTQEQVPDSNSSSNKTYSLPRGKASTRYTTGDTSLGRGGGSHTTRRKRDERNNLVELLQSTLTTWQAQQPSKKQKCNQDQSLISILENILRDSKQRNDDDDTVATNILQALEHQQQHYPPQEHKRTQQSFYPKHKAGTAAAQKLVDKQLIQQL